MRRIHLWLIGILIVFTILLRVPSLFEPYWYGDEGIYLILGQMMQRGAILYRDIWDNKPPLLYLLYAINPTLLWAKLSALVFVSATVSAVFVLAQNFFQRSRVGTVAAFVTAVLSSLLFSLPVFEGTIANAELFFTLPITIGAILVWKMTSSRPTAGRLILVGVLAFLAFGIKVPAVFDFFAFGLFGFVLILEATNRRQFLSQLPTRVVKVFGPPTMIFSLLFGIMIAYFFLNQALGDFLTASFFQNASYVAVDTGPLAKLSNPLIVRGIILVAGCLLLVAGYFRKLISKELLFLSLWFGFSLYGALLSNRPYLHYLLQIVPPFVVLISYLIINLKRFFWFFVPLFLTLYFLFPLFKGGFALETRSYYRNWFDYLSERRSFEQFANYFDGRTSNSYAIGDYIKSKTDSNDPIFVWGDSAFVYVLSERPAATKFIQAHHLTTIDRANYKMIMDRLKKLSPKVIVVSEPVIFPFPELDQFLEKNYRQTQQFLRLTVYETRS